jgi:hypothetical protein
VDARKLALTHAEAGHLELLRGGEAGDARADHNRMLLRERLRTQPRPKQRSPSRMARHDALGCNARSRAHCVQRIACTAWAHSFKC